MRGTMSNLQRRALSFSAALVLTLGLAACGGGGGGSSKPAPTDGGGGGTDNSGTFLRPLERSLTQAEVRRIIAQAVQEADARGAPAVIAVTDRVGNVLAIFKMNGAPNRARIPDNGRAGRPPPGTTAADFLDGPFGIQGLGDPDSPELNLIPSEAAAVAKAITGAYLSSAGNAFTTRTASFIVQENFPPGPTGRGLESGPLFGVQFSSLPCSDLVTRFNPMSLLRIGPHRSPLGLSADPGGLPLYKDGVVVGGIGVFSDGIYGLDEEPQDTDTDNDELIAVAGTVGFAAPVDIRAERIPVDGTTLRYADKEFEALMSDPATAPSFGSIAGTAGNLVPLRGYYEGMAVLAGTAYGSEASGIRPATPAEYPDDEIYILTDGSGNNRYPPRDGTDGAALGGQNLTEAEVRELLLQAFEVMRKARAQIRRPLNSRAQVTVSVVDTNGVILGILRSPDAPIFGTDVSLQKARTAAFFSGPNAADDLLNNTTGFNAAEIAGFVPDTRAFFNDPTALTGAIAFADRSGGNISRPFYPDGERDREEGPLSRDFSLWSIFNTGLQEALIRQNLAQHLLFLDGVTAMDTRPRCTFVPDVPGMMMGQNRLQNGIQIFPGSVPIYRGNTLVGGIGVSGDGIDQDDMISFLGTHNAGEALGGAIQNAPKEIRADTIVVKGVRLRYITCPFNPFVGSNEQNICLGK